jgi:hypothetical protein
LKGHRIFAVAGNDAHGNFNRFRQLSIPFVLMTESNDNRFGEMKTAALLRSGVTERGVLEAISAGRSMITNGPVAILGARSGKSEEVIMGSSLRGREVEISIQARSTPEFGALQRIVLWRGITGETREESMMRTGCVDYSFSQRLNVQIKRGGYFRLEVWTSPKNDFSGVSHFCFTNPIWISP